LSNWLKSIIGKPLITQEEDYFYLMKEMEKFGYDVINILKDFVSEAANVEKKDELVADWEKLIIKFYKRDNSENIFVGQLRKSYLSQMAMKGRFNYNINYLTKRKLAEWIKKMCYHEEEIKINSLNDILNFSGGKLSSSTQIQIVDKIKELQQKKDMKKKQISTYIKCSVKELDSNVYCYIDYYIKRLPEKIQTELPLLDEKCIETLLPQDIIQYIIAEDFNGVDIL